MTSPLHIVWFKRDLRVQDHAPLVAACSAGEVLPLFAWEPTVWVGDDMPRSIKPLLASVWLSLK